MQKPYQKIRHFQMRPRISIRGSVRPSVGQSVRPSVTSYFQNLKTKVFLRGFYQGSLGTSQMQNSISIGNGACWSVHLSMLKVEKKSRRMHLLVDKLLPISLPSSELEILQLVQISTESREGAALPHLQLLGQGHQVGRPSLPRIQTFPLRNGK